MQIQRVGVEYEGGWACACDIHDTRFDASTLREKLGLVVPEDVTIPECHCQPPNFHRDGSVSGVSGNWVGEISAVGGLPPGEWEEFHRKWYPPFVNLSCGMHVHVSMHPKIYMSIVTPRLESFLIGELVRWGKAFKIPYTHPFWTRLAGGNHYTKIGITHEIIQKQLRATGRIEERYYATNYCWTKHGTLEIRVLPMFKQSRTAERAINAVVRALERFIKLREPSTKGYVSKAAVMAHTVQLVNHQSVSMTPIEMTTVMRHYPRPWTEDERYRVTELGYQRRWNSELIVEN